MKTSLRKLRGLGLHKHNEKRERHLHQALAKLDELSQASQDMQDMRDFYDSLLSAAAAMANSAYEFSESLGEMGNCLLEKIALNDDEESGKVLLMLGKVQFVFQDLVDRYRSHIFQTITIPSESLLNELRIVEEMKKQCDDKRRVYEDMIPKCRGKGRSRSSKGDCFSTRELQAARDEYDEEATIFVFRMKSLKGGQSQSLLTQAARHHAAQMSFFRKALKSLEEIEPHVKFVTEQQHIEYHFGGLLDDEEDDGDYDDDDDDDDDGDDDDDYNNDNFDNDSAARDDNELSFDYGQNDQGQDISTSRDSMELDNVDLEFPKVSTVATVKKYSHRKPGGNSFLFGRDLDPSSKSAPLLVGKDPDPGERFQPTWQSSARKFYTYVLPTPGETKSPVSLRSDRQVPQMRRASVCGGQLNLWHSSPLEPKKYDKILGNEKLSGPILSNTQSVLKESNSNTISSRLLHPMTEGLSSQLDQCGDTIKIRRQAFSGPLTGKSWSNRPSLSASGPIGSTGNALLFSRALLHTPLPRPSSSEISVSPTFTLSPKISELHELPRPPACLASKGPSNLRHSSPLVTNGQELSDTNKLMPTNAISTLPSPTLTIHRSYSIPYRGQREMELHFSRTLETSQDFKVAEDIASPPLTPISLLNS